jgi:hypothetical protein
MDELCGGNVYHLGILVIELVKYTLPSIEQCRLKDVVIRGGKRTLLWSVPNK